jgi:acyl-CoA synthetase (AMP-forming)/AMP-acid ligase II
LVPHEYLARAAETCGERTALVDPKGSVTFAELYELTQRLASGLHGRGIRRGDIVAVLLPNSITFALAYYATSYLGAVFMPIDPRLVPVELNTIMQHAAPSALLVSERFADTVSTILHKPEVVIWSDRMGSGDVSVAPVSVEPEDTVAIMYTSGTTGIPKGAVLPARVWDCFPKALEAVWHVNEDDIGLLSVPMSHLSGPVYLNACVYFPLKIVIMDRFSPRVFAKNIAEHRVTFCHVAPSMLNMINRLPEDGDSDFSTVRLLATFGALTTPDVTDAFEKRFGFRVATGYGLTEAAPLVAVSLEGEGIHKPYSIGKPVEAAGVKVEIVNERGEPVPTGEIGEVIISGPVVMKEYHKNPEATREILKDGWIYTGDLGKFDDQGYVYIMGRKKDVIIVSGLNVYAGEVESVLQSHTAVKEAAIVGERDERASERVIAYVVLDDVGDVSAEDLKSFCRKSLATYKVPSDIHFIDELPKTPTGKVDKTKFKERVFDEPAT